MRHLEALRSYFRIAQSQVDKPTEMLQSGLELEEKTDGWDGL
jgi:hypothetical protein